MTPEQKAKIVEEMVAWLEERKSPTSKRDDSIRAMNTHMVLGMARTLEHLGYKVEIDSVNCTVTLKEKDEPNLAVMDEYIAMSEEYYENPEE